MTHIAHDIQGSGPPVLLLHGFPQTRAMWRPIAQALAQDFTVVTADLRGYGDSFKPTGMADMGFRPMAADQVALMHRLGFDRFCVIGHDRGGRTAHRMALDNPEAVRAITLLDIIPTAHLLSHISHQTARAYYHWFFLSQPEPTPETLIGHDPDGYFNDVLLGLGAGEHAFEAQALAAYRTAWRDAEAIRCMCNDYRAAIDVDLALDRADSARRLQMPACVLYGAQGIMAQHFDVAQTWQPHFAHLTSGAIPGGHFFPDTHPNETTTALRQFLRSLPA